MHTKSILLTLLLITPFATFGMGYSFSAPIDDFLKGWQELSKERKEKAQAAEKLKNIQAIVASIETYSATAETIFNQLDALSYDLLEDFLPFRDVFEEHKPSKELLKNYFELLHQKENELYSIRLAYRRAATMPAEMKKICIGLCDKQIEKMKCMKEIFTFHTMKAFYSNLPEFHPTGYAKTDSGWLVPIDAATHIGQITPYGKIVKIKPK